MTRATPVALTPSPARERPQEQLQDLKETVATLPEPDAVPNGLEATLRDADEALSRAKIASARGILNDFITPSPRQVRKVDRHRNGGDLDRRRNTNQGRHRL